MALGNGSIAFIGFNADGDDGFAFIAIDPIPAGAVIRFSDNEWNGIAIGGTPAGAFNTGEGGSNWTNGATEIAAGTVIELLHTSSAGLRTANIGTISGGNISLGNSGESIFAFIGTDESTPTTFLAAVTNNNGGFSGGITSGLLDGTGLTAGSTALVLPGTGGADVAAYNPATAGSSFAAREAAFTAFNTTANWVAQDASGDQDADGIVPDAPFLGDAQSPIAGVTFTIGAPASDATPPTFTSSSTFNAGENQTAVGSVAASDASAPVTFAINGGEDAALFSITAGGVLTFVSAPDFEGASFDGDDIYEVTVRASDAASPANTADQQIQVTVTDVAEDGPPPATIVINEVDADQTGTDGASFIELYGAPGASLAGYTLVLYNGSNDQSYAAFDLSSFSLDANGYFVLGNAAVANVDLTLTGDFLQNGADAVALYLAPASNFPNGTAVTAANLVDAVVYENNNPDDRGLIDVLTPGQVQINENDRGAGATQSLQRITDGAGGARNTSAFTEATPTPGAANVLPAAPAAAAAVTHKIHDVQGNPTTQTDDGFGDPAGSPLRGQTVTLEGIVVGDFQSGDGDARHSLNGFYLQEENADFDADALTSEGIFIFGGNTDVNEGDLVRVTGVVQENFGLTRIQVTGITIVDDAFVADVNSLAVTMDLPTATATLNQNGKYQPQLEAYEGMLVHIPQTLTITEQFNLDRFNEIKLSANGQLETFTNENEPSVPGYAAHLQAIGARTITYDDGQNTQNESINNFGGLDPDDDGTGPSATFPSEPGYNTASAYRMGDTVTGLTGVLDYQFAGDATASGSTWRVRAIDDGANTFTHADVRPVTPPSVGGTLKVASFNVLNYFVTLDDPTTTADKTAIGLDPRGANNAAEFQRQTDKLVNFIITLDADVIGLTELENDFFDSNPNDGNPEGNAIAYLVGQINARLGANTYSWVNPGSQLDNGQFFGGDAIAVGFIYKPSKVEVAFGTTIEKLDDGDPEAAALLGQSTIGHIFNGVNTSRAALAVTFEQLGTDEQFTAVINHFKSKSGAGTGVDADQLDGQGAWQNQRELAAKALADWVSHNPTGTTDTDVILLGDFNAYLKEDAVDLIENAGFHNLAEERIADPSSYVFDGQYGALDHAFASGTLNGQVTGVAEWHVNADEADALDYNTDFDKDPLYFDASSVARESDHDPVIIGLKLDSAPATTDVNGVTVYTAAPSLTGTPGAAPVATNALQLVRLGAYATTNDAGTGASPNAEVVAYDKTTAKFYVQNTNEGHIEIVTLSGSGALTKTGDINLTALPSYGGVNSVAVHNGVVAVAYANSAGDQPGRVVLFDGNGTLIKSLTVGIGPDQVVFTADGSKLLVANEAEMAGSAASQIQTAGGISIIDLSGGAANATVRNTIGFDALNGAEAQLRANGLAITPGNSAGNDIEPEYITASPDGTKAYVTLQEVNGVAVIDLTNATATKPLAILPLGAINHSLAGNEFDASDRDGPGGTVSIKIATTPAGTPIYGLLQPDAIASFTTNGATYFVTANEGDQRVISGVEDVNDVARLSAISNSSLTPELQALKADPNYARLNVLLRYGDIDNDGVIDQLHTLGGRGISIFKQEIDGSFTKVRETGGEFEKIFASIAPERFNNDQVVANTVDDRSDNKGPEPEGVTVGEINGHVYAFVGLERQSGVMVYDVTNPAIASFVSYVPPLAGSTADLGPEVLKFIAAADNPTGTALVATANEAANGGMTLYAALEAGQTQQVQFASGSLNVVHPEGNSGTTAFTFTVERTGGTLGDVNFTVRLASSAATANDFSGVASLPATISGAIAAGATSATVTVQVAGDTAIEPDESFTLTLQSATATQPGITAAVNAAQKTATGLIQNEELSAPMPFTLQLLHLSDGEAGLLASTTAPNLAALVDKFEDAYANHTLILSGGDNFIPGPFLSGGTDLSLKAVLNAVTGSTISADPAVNIPIAAVDIAILNSIGVEASAIGNHDFDLGSRVLADAITPGAGWVGAAFPYLSANLDFSGDNNADFRLGQRFTNTVGNGATPTNLASTLAGRVAPATVVVKDGEKIGLIGATTQLLESISSPTGTEVKGFPTGPGPNGEDDNMTLLAAQLQPIIDEMIAEGINKIIVQSHLQLLGNEEALAKKLHGVDIILAAGSHTRTNDGTPPPVAFPGHDANAAREYPIQTTGDDGKPILIVATDNEYTYLGRLVVDFDANGEIITSSVGTNAGINGTYASTAANVAAAWGVTEAQLATTAFADGTKGDKVEKLTQAVQSVINTKDGAILGFTEVYLEGDRAFIRNQETNLGDLASDANAFAAKHALPNGAFVVSLQNGGGIRAQIGAISEPDPVTGEIDKLPPSANPAANKPEGAVSQLDLENSLRFNNRLMVFDTTPEGLLKILNWGAGVAPNAGGFPQIGGVRYSYDPDLPGNGGSSASAPGAVIGSRIRDVALIDENGNVIAKIVDDGVVLPGAPAKISVVVPNFTANDGDGYPIKANGENFRFLLSNGTLSAPMDESLNFTATNVVPANALGQQDAFAVYMNAFHGTQATAYDQADTPQTLDTRIQNLNVRSDGVFDSAPINGGSGIDFLPGTVGNDTIKAGAGVDFVTGGLGDDKLDGGAGDDTAIFNVDFNTVQVLIENGQIVIVSAEGRDTVTNFEHFQFTDGRIDVNDGNPLIDDLFYYAKNKDVWDAGADADAHYNSTGWKEGRDPNPEFSTKGYLAANPDVKALNTNPLLHYDQFGWKQDRDPSLGFDTKLYLLHNPDVAAAGIDPLLHYEQFGRAEGRAAYEAVGNKIVGGFDAQYYLFTNPDVAAAGIDPLQHFNSVGWKEGRDPNSYFDTKGYLDHYADVKAANINPLTHYISFGWKEGRDPSTEFDTTDYLSHYTDIAAANINPLQHFLTFGIYENRSPHADGIWG